MRYASLNFLKRNILRKKKPTVKRTGSGGSSGNYIFGKINNFYALKLGYGYRRMIAGKPDPGTVSIHWIYSGGFSVGLSEALLPEVAN